MMNAMMKEEVLLQTMPDLEILENEAHGQRQAQRVRLVLMSVLVFCAMIAMALEGRPHRPVLFWIASAVTLFVLAFRQHRFLLNRNLPLSQWKKSRIGLFTPERISELFDELIIGWKDEKMPPPMLFISSVRNRPAFTVRNCLTSDPRFHAVYLGEDIFFWLNGEELRGILAHELAHYYRYSGAMMRCYPLVLAIMAFFPLTVIEILHVNDIFLAMVLWPVLYFAVRFILLGLQRSGVYWQEYLADAAAVRASSPLDAVNGLLLVHKRMDNLVQAYRHLLRLMKKNTAVPLSLLDGLIEEIWAQLPRRIMRGQTVSKVVEDLFQAVVRVTVPGGEDGPVRNERRNRQIARMLRQTRPLVRRHLNWETLRRQRHSWRLDPAGYNELIQSLLREPDKQLTLFGSSGERRGKASHPQLRKRILFIHKNFVLQN